MKSTTFLSGLVILGLLVACGPSVPTATPTPEPTPTPVEVLADGVEDVVGIWALPESRYLELLADGTLRVFGSVELSEGWTIATGQFWFEGTVFNTTDTINRDEGKYEVRLVQQGGETIGLRWKVIEDASWPRHGCRGLTPRASTD
jgi:hypothetical protein